MYVYNKLSIVYAKSCYVLKPNEVGSFCKRLDSIPITIFAKFIVAPTLKLRNQTTNKQIYIYKCHVLYNALVLLVFGAQIS